MNGKLLKISNNDLYGNVDDRKIAVFAAFTHVKYMNKYAIFAYSDEYNKNKLYCGSIHLKSDSLVVFAVRDDEINYISKFVNDYMNNTLDSKEYELIDISNISKIELVSSSSYDFDKLDVLDNLSIKKENVLVEEETPKNKKPVFLYILLVILFLLLIGITYLYFNPELLTVKLNKLDCTMQGYDRKVELNYTSDVAVRFDINNELKDMEKIDVYSFKDINEYNEFKNNNNESKYFKVDGGYKYDDDKMELKIIYKDNLIIYKYDEILSYLENQGYSCIEGTYDE